MNLKTVLITITFILLIWILIDSVLQLDIAATKNIGLINAEKQKVDSFQNIDSIRAYAKSNLDVIRKNTRNNSTLATKRIWMILIVAIIQLVLWVKLNRKELQ